MMFDAPLKIVVIILVQSVRTDDPSSNLSSLGTTVHPRRTPVKPAGFENELISNATSFAPSISKIDFGMSGA